MSGILERFPDLRCPSCRGTRFEPCADRIHCEACGEDYAIVDGSYPRMLRADADIAHHEVAVQDAVASCYEEARYKNPWSRRYHAWWTQLMIRHIDRAGRILDNGCGTGELSEALPDEWITGIDVSSEMVRIAGRKYWRTLIGDSQTLPFTDASFDVVIARSLLHHLPNPAQGLAEMARVLRPGGEVVAVDTNRSLLSVLPRVLAGRTRHFSSEHKNFNARELVALFNAHFTVKAVRFFGYAGYPILGFPDLIDCFKYFPAKELCYRVLMGVDETLARVPLVRSQAWAVLIKARKR